LGLTNFTSHDESDAVAIALCHLLNKNFKSLNIPKKKKTASKKMGNGLASALAHKIKEKAL
jgi:hypothetical protein